MAAGNTTTSDNKDAAAGTGTAATVTTPRQHQVTMPQRTMIRSLDTLAAPGNMSAIRHYSKASTGLASSLLEPNKD